MNQSEWITDRVPDQGRTVLMRTEYEGTSIALGYHAEGVWRWADSREFSGRVMGWMKLGDAAALLSVPCSGPVTSTDAEVELKAPGVYLRFRADPVRILRVIEFALRASEESQKEMGKDENETKH